MDARDFEQQLEAARQGDQRSFARLWRHFNPPVVRYLRVLGAAGDVEDLGSITWIEVVRGLDRFTGGEAEFRAWLFTIARRRLLDHKRNMSRRPRTVAPLEGMENPDHRADPQLLSEEARSTEAALDLIATLPPDQAELVVLRVVAGMDVAAVAELVGMKPGTVRVNTHRALKKLAKDLLVAPADGDVERNDGAPGGA